MSQDAKLVSMQPHEIALIATKFGCSKALVVEAKEAVGNNREKIEAYITEKQKQNTQ